MNDFQAWHKTKLAMDNSCYVNCTTLFQGITDKDASVYLNPEQPLIRQTRVTQEDVDKQEAVVRATRKSLAEAMAKLRN